MSVPLPSKAEDRAITVSVVSHGHRELTAALLRQLADLNNADIVRVVVTHNLPESDLEKPAHAGYELIQLHNPKPLGFSANHNRAFAHCATPWYAVLNPDLSFDFGDPFPALLSEASKDPKLGAIAPALVQPGTGHVEPNRGAVTPFELIRRRLPGHVPPAEPSWLVGAFMLIRSEAYRELGGFDERFRLYCEDVDLGLRLRDAGWRIRRIESTHVAHLTQRHSHKSLRFTAVHISSLFRLWIRLLISHETQITY